MLNFTAKDKEQWNEIRQGWLSLLVLVVLLFSHQVADRWFGRGWAAVTAAIAVALWLVVRPWQFGLLPPHVRKTMRLQGAVILTFFALGALLRYGKG